MIRRWLLKWVGWAVAVVLLASVWQSLMHSGKKSVGQVALVPIQGPIVTSEKTVDLIARYANQDSVKAMVLRVDSPGGGVGAAQEIVREMERARRKGKVLVASLGSMAASGGYYVACAADWIMADTGTLTGSIGVIISLANAEELLKKIGLRFDVVKSGTYKDVGSISRRLTKDEERLLQEVIDDIYYQFVDAIVKGREKAVRQAVAAREKIKPEAVTPEMIREAVIRVADGRIFSGLKAKEYGLVDGFGNLNDAIEEAGKLAGIPGVPEVVEERKFSLMRYLMGEQVESVAERLALEWLPLRYQLQF